MDRLCTRREIVAGAFAAAGAGAGVAVAVVADPAAADSPPLTDAQALSKALEVERLLVLAYRRVLASGTLSADIERAIAPYLNQEVQHASAVVAALAAMGVRADTSALGLDAAGDLLSKHNIPVSLTGLHSQNDAMRLLVDLESLAEGVYFTALEDAGHPTAPAPRRSDHGVRGSALDRAERLAESRRVREGGPVAVRDREQLNRRLWRRTALVASHRP